MTRKHYWVWPIATYLFLGGLGGGIMFLSWILHFFFDLNQALAMPILIAVFCLGIGCFLLVFELGQPQVFLRVFISKSAIIKWGAVILSVALIFGFVGWTFYVPFLPWATTGASAIRDACLALAGLFGLFTMVYTGVLLSSMKSKPFWNTPLLPILFTVSATSTGSAMMALTMGMWPFAAAGHAELATMQEMLHSLHVIDQGLIFVEMGVMFLWVLLMFASSNVTAKACARRWLVGSWAWIFWGAMLVVGLIVPLWFYFLGLEVTNTIAALLVLYGGLLLRFMIVFTDDRREIPGETRFYSRIPKGDEQFLHPVWEEK